MVPIHLGDRTRTAAAAADAAARQAVLVGSRLAHSFCRLVVRSVATVAERPLLPKHGQATRPPGVTFARSAIHLQSSTLVPELPVS